MKITVDKNKEIEYPCLMQSPHGRILLMKSEKKGTVINNYDGDMGRVGDSWASHDFKPFTGSVTLEND